MGVRQETRSNVGITCLKCVASFTFRIGFMKAAWTTEWISLAEYPSVASPSFLKSSVSKVCCMAATSILKMVTRSNRSGNAICTYCEKRFRIMDSSCQGLVVAPKTKTPFLTWSICEHNLILVRRDTPVGPQSVSMLSIKTIEGLFCHAAAKRSLTKLTR